MIKAVIVAPSKAILQVSPEDRNKLFDCTSYKNTGAEFQYQKHLKNFRWKRSNPSAWKAHGEELKKKVNQTLLYEENGELCIRPGYLPYLEQLMPVSIENKIIYPKARPYPWYRPVKFTPYPYQISSVEKLIEHKHANVELCTGCHAKNTKILMFDGSLKNVQDVRVGDLLMGPDSSPRTVIELHTGYDEMYTIKPLKGEPFTVNKGHILSLQFTDTKREHSNNKKKRKDFKGLNRIENISVEEYLKLSKGKRHRAKLYRVGVNFKENNNLEIPPRILGMWLGGGASNQATFTTIDTELESVWAEYLKNIGLKITINKKPNNRSYSVSGVLETCAPSGKTQDPFVKVLKNLNLFKNKHIPQKYLVNSRQNRLELLAGLIDTDGYLRNSYYEIVQKNKTLAENIVFLARSLGFAAYLSSKKSKSQNGTKGEYFRINIFGDISNVPVLLDRKKAPKRKQIKNVLRTGFKVEKTASDIYYGFSVDKDRLYVMGDFTVTHNSGKSLIVMMVAQKLGLKTIVVTPSVSIFNEILEKFEYHFEKSVVGALGGGKKRLGKNIMICVSDSVANLKEGSKEYAEMSGYQVLLADESHTIPAASLEKMCHGVLKDIPYRFFFSGTQTRSDGTEKLLHSIIGRTVHSLSTKEGIGGGFICDHEFRIVKVRTTRPGFVSDDALAMKRAHFLHNDNIAAFIGKLANSVYKAKGEQTLVLVDEIDQIHRLIKYLEVPYACATGDKSFDKPEKAVEKFNKGDVKVLIGTSCISTGTNIFPTHHTVNWQGGTSEIKVKQGAVGRSVRKLKGSDFERFHVPKEKAIIWDFDVVAVPMMERHLRERISYYKDSGVSITRL